MSPPPNRRLSPQFIVLQLQVLKLDQAVGDEGRGLPWPAWGGGAGLGGLLFYTLVINDVQIKETSLCDWAALTDVGQGSDCRVSENTEDEGCRGRPGGHRRRQGQRDRGQEGEQLGSD